MAGESKAVVTVLGFDRKGIIARVSGVLFERGINILNISQTILEGYFSMVMIVDLSEPSCPFDELQGKNTGDNTPAVLHLRIVPGDRVRFLATAKGFGSENMSAVKMCTPSEGEQGVVDFIVDTARRAGPNPCPPMIIGVGVGGTLEQAALLAKRMTARPVGSRHPDPRYARIEQDTLSAVNRLGIGPAGIGGRTTALAVNPRQSQ